MKWVVAVLAVAFALSVAGTAVAEPLQGSPAVVTSGDPSQDVRSPDAASGFIAPDVSGSADDGLSAAMIVLLAVGGVLALGGGGFVVRRAMLSRRHAVA